MDQISDNQEKEHKIQEFIRQNFPAAQQRDIAVDELLLGANIIDSIGILQIVTYLEEEYDIMVEDDEFIPDNFQSISHIANFVQSKLI